MAASCDHSRMLGAVKVPVLFTHHFRHVEEATGFVIGAISDLQAGKVREIIEQAGQSIDYRSFPQMGQFDARSGSPAVRRHPPPLGGGDSSDP